MGWTYRKELWRTTNAWLIPPFESILEHPKRKRTEFRLILPEVNMWLMYQALGSTQAQFLSTSPHFPNPLASQDWPRSFKIFLEGKIANVESKATRNPSSANKVTGHIKNFYTPFSGTVWPSEWIVERRKEKHYSRGEI